MTLLRRGDRGPAVAALQQSLRRLGADLKDEDSLFGLYTEAAVYLLQREDGLGTDGIVGPATAERLQQERRPAAFSRPLLQIIEGVPYFTQRDNFHHPSGTCNVSALAMALAYHGVRPGAGRQLEDELFEDLTSKEGMDYFQKSCPEHFRKGLSPNTVFDMLVWVAGRRGGVAATFSEARSLEELRAEIAARRPAVISGAFTGSGHIVLLIGFTAAGDLICHDPWGDWMRGYRTAEGEARIYERDQVLAILKQTGSDKKWGLFVTPQTVH